MVLVVVQGIGGTECMRSAAVLEGCPGDDVGAMVRARASILAEVELERLNLQQKRWKEKGEGGKGQRKKKREEKTGKGR